MNQGMLLIGVFLNGLLTTSSKRIFLLRHGVTEMNEYLCLPSPNNEYGNPAFVDPQLWDTRLSKNGVKLAKQKNEVLKESSAVNFKNIDIIYSSPLTRALQTADIVLNNDVVPTTVPRVTLPLLAERLWLSSDVGRTTKQLKQEFPNWDMSNVSESRWWYDPSDHTDEELERRPAGSYCTHLEPAITFKKRIDKLRLWLSNQPYNNIVLVAHWGVFKELTDGYSMDNCEIKEYSLDSIVNMKKKWVCHT